MNDLKEIGGFIVSADPYVNHDNSLSGNGTLTSPLGVVPGYNETVLFSGGMNTNTCTLSESPLNFERVKFYLADDGGHTSWGSTEIKSEDLTACSGTDGQCKAGCAVPWSEGFRIMTVSSTSANSYRNWKSCGYQWWGNGGGQIGTGYLNILEVVGINRKQ